MGYKIMNLRGNASIRILTDKVSLYCWLMFGCKCIRCRKNTNILHELFERSLRPETWNDYDNIVPLCAACHDWAHSVGTNTSRPILIGLRTQRLREYYGHYRKSGQLKRCQRVN